MRPFIVALAVPALGAFRPGDLAGFVPAADPASAEDRAMSDQIAVAWAAFATTGEANAPGQPRWPAHDLAADTVRHFARARRTGSRNEASNIVRRCEGRQGRWGMVPTRGIEPRTY